MSFSLSMRFRAVRGASWYSIVQSAPTRRRGCGAAAEGHDIYAFRLARRRP
jgi:hypothetical protein